MTRRRPLFLTLLSLVSLPPLVALPDARAQERARPNTLTKAEQKAGWRLLFDGRTTAGWRGYKRQEVPPGWQAQDGSLTRVGRAGDLVTIDQFEDFELAFDWRLAPKGNSGIIYRLTEDQESSWQTGPEYQIFDDAAHPRARTRRGGAQLSGALYDLYPPAKDVVKPAGQWNTSRIVARGKHLEHWLNGVKVVQAEVDSEDWAQRMAGSKWAKQPRYGRNARGHIGLQDHGAKVEYRDIKLRDLGGGAKAAIEPAEDR